MTQAVLRNEISDLQPKISLTREHRLDIASKLGDVLSDTFRLFVNAQGLHWNVEGPMFYSVHKLTEQQYEDLAESLDAIAERIRALGMPAPESVQEYIDRSKISDLPKESTLNVRISRMIQDYEDAAARMATVVKLAEEANDVKTADLLTDRIGTFEGNAWMLRATIAKS